MKLSATSWLDQVEIGVKESVPDVTVVRVHDHCVSVASVKAVIAITVAYDTPVVNSALADDQGLWSHDGVKLEMRDYSLDSTSVDEAVNRVASLI